MKAQLNFDLDEKDDAMAHLRCIKSLDMALVLWELFYNTRKSIESELDNKPDADIYEGIDLLYKRFHDLLDEYNIITDELVE